MFVIKNLMFSVMALGLAMTANAQEQTLQKEEIPVEITSFIEQHFSSTEVMNAKKEKDEMEVSYEVELQDGTELEFNENKEVVSIDNDSPLPESVIPPLLLDYVNSQYPGKKITSWELDDNEQQLELDDDTELVFDTGGNFIREDD
ncbi:PepSY-like domain-containing protein [Membranicola marinus]|uniref:PepSY-like domain-containing protein n=1 Tax=Membranihabitans marinus TaxID=1227546 RepID=A0A953L8T8_9BACT|nr:PepSY-like domain-containing protein [Membranihabitans marinus]MBY5958080.1 PepSY-like domain-containing protein [Membranihabitans marinus]